MDESGLDHMFSSASFHEVAYSSNQHATSLPNGVENICSAIEDIPTACQVPEGASLAGNSSSTLDMMTSADEANFIQPHISLQGQRFNESYGIFSSRFKRPCVNHSQQTRLQQTTFRPLHLMVIALRIAIFIKTRMIFLQWGKGMLCITKCRVSIPQPLFSEEEQVASGNLGQSLLNQCSIHR